MVKQTGSAMPQPQFITEESTVHLEYIGSFYCTSYCPCSKCCGKYALNRGDKITGAIGKELISGKSIAVDPSVIPYGSTVYIDGQLYTAVDTGDFSGFHIDIYYDTHEEALSHPNKYADVYAVEIW